MSRLTASPFHKPSPFEFPRAPLSPPETLSDHMGSALPTTISVLGGTLMDPHVEAEPVHRSQSPETAGARFRRVSSLAYHSSGLRESRERTIQRSSRSFVVVIPPPALLHEHGQLGHTLSLGPRHRLAHGMLMPLFPTMYGQLAAIAKEFNFPSITGICLYFHFTENGITATPRISDDSWQMIWSNVLDPSAPSLRVPIVGKLEFDIDTRHARWFSAWIASAHREHLDVPASVGPSTAAPSIAAHYRDDSRATDMEINLDNLDSESVSPHSGRPSRHVPRKLSLVDRLDSSLRAVARAAPQTSSPENSASVQALSPIFQEDEPKTAKIVESLEKRVNTWRASASLTPSALAAKGQTSLEPANLPNTMTLDDVADGEEELNLEDFAWSISSLGPNDWADGSVASWDRLPSVHLAHRMESSVCMTPSDCTSFGPSDYTLPSPVPSLERVFTPDIAHRMFEDCPPTPTTATSWGPPSEYPPSPMSFRRVSSVDLGDRAIFSPPVTPMTATSWGPVSWPPSPATPYYVHTPDIGQRTFEAADLILPARANWGWPYWRSQSSTTSTPWNQVWPYISTNASTAAKPWGQVWPYISADASTAGKPWGHSWPYSASMSPGDAIREPGTSLASYGYPDFNMYPEQQQSTQGLSPVSVHLPCAYPSLKIYPSVYPNFDLYPAEPLFLAKEVVKADGYPYLEIYPPVLRKRLPDVQVVKISWGYPFFDLYPAVYPSFALYPSVERLYLSKSTIKSSVQYPFFDLYPSVQSEAAKKSSLAQAGVKTSGYPDFDIYPATLRKRVPDVHYPFFILYPEAKETRSIVKTTGYPDFGIYPPILRKRLPEVQIVKTAWAYPIFDLYPAVNPFTMPLPGDVIRQSGTSLASCGYPDFNIYPEREQLTQGLSSVSVHLPCAYPSLKIYPSVYPDFDLYPAVPLSLSKKAVKADGYPYLEIYPPILRKRLPDAQVIKISWGYPIFDLYPAVFPSFALYPSVERLSLSESTVKSSVQYPFFDLYPSVQSGAAKNNYLAQAGMRTSGYPDFDIYPATVRKQVPDVHYPFFNLYPEAKENQSIAKTAAYPDFDIYPPILRKRLSKVQVVKTAWAYPIFDLYPAIYPPIVEQLSKSTITSKTQYPFFDLYPAVRSEKRTLAKQLVKTSGYPDSDIYPRTSWKRLSDVHYPFFNLYPAVRSEKRTLAKQLVKTSGYPDFDIYPQVLRERLPDVQVIKLVRSYPIFDLYPAVYPFVASDDNLVKKDIQIAHKTVRSHRSLHFEVFPDGLVSTPSGTLPKKQGLTVRIAVTPEAHRSHRSLHDEVFPDKNAIFTPSGSMTPSLEVRTFSRPPVSPRGARTPEPARPIARARSGSVSARPLSAAVGLPTRPNLRSSTAESLLSTRLTHQDLRSMNQPSTPPMRSASLRNGPAAPQTSSSQVDSSPLRKAASSISASRTSSLRGTHGLAPVAEADHSVLDRSASMGRGPASASTPLQPRKRDSVVLQRIRAFEDTEPNSSRLSLKTLKEFPLPPPPPPPSGGLPALPTDLSPRRTSLMTQSRP